MWVTSTQYVYTFLGHFVCMYYILRHSNQYEISKVRQYHMFTTQAYVKSKCRNNAFES
jgi:hypothetical protein